MFRLLDGREHLYQWDSDVRLAIDDESITEVHFCNRTDTCSLVCEVQEENKLRFVFVPNILLQTDWNINIYAYDKTYTKHSAVLAVKGRTRPADYIYTETEIKRFEDLETRIAYLEENGTGGTGEQGKDGLSAYEVAVKNGFVGTEQEWLQSLQGEPGAKGDTGKDGKPGTNGVSATHSWNGTVLTITSASGTSSADLKGATGAQGIPGEKGEPGAAGKDGAQGSPGKDGENGISATHTWDGTVLTITSASGTSSADLKGAKGDTGSPGKDGANGSPGEKGDTGEPGKDGVSATHSWNGTVLTITSASGTSSADLKGEKGEPGKDGETGSQGIPGENGQRGTGILKVSTAPTSYTTTTGGQAPIKRMNMATIKSEANVSEVLIGDCVAHSYYLYHIYYKDATYAYMDKSQSIRGATGSAGSKGADGYTPVKGVDYWTEAEQEAIVQEVITALGTPVFGTIDGNNTITLTGALVDGTYTIKYEDAEGEQITIGTLERTSAPVVTYTNLANPSDSYWQEGKRINSSGVLTDWTGGVITNFIDVSGCKEYIHVKGIDLRQGNSRYYKYNTVGGDLAIGTNITASGHVETASYDSSVTLIPARDIESAKIWRLGGLLTGTSADVIITIDEEIK